MSDAAEQLIEVALRTGSRELDLRGHRLTALPESLAELTELTTLYLGGNRLTALPGSLAELTELTTLYLGTNQLTEAPRVSWRLVGLSPHRVVGTF